MHHSKQVRSEAAAFHAEGRSTVRVSALMSFALILVLGVIPAMMSLAHLA
jgi:hypothetical protein